MKKVLAFLASFALVCSLSGCFGFERAVVSTEPPEAEEVFRETDTIPTVALTLMEQNVIS